MTCHLLERYAALGIRLSADGDRLAIDAPAGTLTPGLADELRRNKPVLLAALTVPEPAPGPPMDSAPIGPGRPAATAPVQPELVHSGDGRPDNLGDQAEATEFEYCNRLQNLVPDLGDRLPADGEWDSLPEPEPCPRCGEILAWWGVWDERRCSVCEPSGQRSLLLANRAARLRARAKQ